MKKFLITKRLTEYKEADFHVIEVYDSREEAESDQKAFSKIKAYGNYEFNVFEGEVANHDD